MAHKIEAAKTWQPDHWTGFFRDALGKAPDSLFAGKRVVEVGIGSGELSRALTLRESSPNYIIGTDISQAALDDAAGNLLSTGPNHRYTLSGRSLTGGRGLIFEPTDNRSSSIEVVRSSLLAKLIEREEVADTIFACIPQVPIPRDVEIEKGDNSGNYYDPRSLTNNGIVLSDEQKVLLAEYDQFGLGLNFKLLLEAPHILAPDGHIILNLGGRPGFTRLMQMFNDAGFDPKLIDSKIIHHDKGTSIRPLAERERKAGHKLFEFFADPQGRIEMTAEEAMQQLEEGSEIYHAIYAIDATLRQDQI